ncbi:MAG: rod shape-determining protein MreC [Oscillospiraceae bacterium]|nr:rod shape-determining protein MreC [Oscillospiraceae bacterium]
MREFIKSIKFKIILCLIALIIGIMLSSLAQNGHSDAGSKFINTIAAPFRYISSAVSQAVDTGAAHIFSSKKYYNENLELKEEISRLKNELVDYDNTKAELSELKKFIGIKEAHEDYVLSPPCRVLSYTANDPFCSFIIDKGSEDGISVADPVVTSDGLIGAVSEISEKYCTVRTILSPELSFGVKAMRKNENGILEGDIKFAADGLSQIIYLEKDTALKPGDTIITTGSSGLFPADYLVGTVKELGKAPNGLSYYASVEPFADIKKLTSVMVITSFEGKGEANEY